MTERRDSARCAQAGGGLVGDIAGELRVEEIDAAGADEYAAALTDATSTAGRCGAAAVAAVAAGYRIVGECRGTDVYGAVADVEAAALSATADAAHAAVTAVTSMRRGPQTATAATAGAAAASEAAAGAATASEAAATCGPTADICEAATATCETAGVAGKATEEQLGR